LSAIAGAVHGTGRDMTAAFLARIAAAAAPRGFDGISQWHDGPAGLIRCHHATTPESVGETQPLTGASGATIAFDGRLDNRDDLLAGFGAERERLQHAADAAIALALFDRHGEDFLDLLVGDWALAIWQPGPRRLFCARSPMGWRPFLWTLERDTFAFATEPRALVVGLGLERRLNEGAIGEMLAARFMSDTDTFWRGIQRLSQGGALTFERGRVRLRHWHVGPFADHRRLSEAEHVARFNELFDQALVSAMRSTTGVGAHLSGGLDSSSIVSRLTELHRAGRVDRQVAPISARFPGEAQDESRYSEAVEAHTGVAARIVSRARYDVDAAAAWCAETLQLPLRPSLLEGTTSGIELQRALGERVLLTGEGGDEWLAGGLGHLPDMLLRGDLPGLVREANSQFPRDALYVRLRRTAFLAAAPLVSATHRARFVTPYLVYDTPMPAWIRPDWAARIGLAERWRSARPPLDPSGFAQKQRYAMYAHARRYVGYEPLYAYAERHGVELRHPFHDLRLTTFMMGASGALLRRNGERKYLLREAMRGTLPELVRRRQDKARFVTSMVDAVIDYCRRRPPRDMTVVRLGWVDPEALVAMLAPVQAWRDDGGRSVVSGQLGQVGPLGFVTAMDLWLEHAIGL
jgi:asparagine synthase (glutamine-hydrolysing)